MNIHEAVIKCPEPGCDYDDRWDTNHRFADDFEIAARHLYRQHWYETHAPTPPQPPEPVVSKETWT